MDNPVAAARPRLTVVGPIFFEVFLPVLDPLPAPGEERYVDSIPTGFGGEMNAASVAAALGVDVTLVHPSGGGMVDLAAEALMHRLGIRSVSWPSRPDPFLSLVFSDGHDRAFLSAGDHACLDHVPEIPVAPWVHVGGVKEAYTVPGRVAEVRAKGAKIAVSGCWSAPHLDLLGRERGQPFDLLVVNRREAEVATGLCAEDAVARLTGASVDVVVTDGPLGAFGILDGAAVRVPALPVPVVDLTGAGDSFITGLIVARLRGMSAPDALTFAAVVASRIVGIRGGTVIDPSLLADLL
jgi:sugar/nucleoside kinase (ribokinase family)